MRMSDWSSDVCSSDLHRLRERFAIRHLRQGFLAGDIESRQRRRHLRDRLQQQRGLADAGVAADQHHPALDQATAEHPVELAHAGTHARVPVVARSEAHTTALQSLMRTSYDVYSLNNKAIPVTAI